MCIILLIFLCLANILVLVLVLNIVILNYACYIICCMSSFTILGLGKWEHFTQAFAVSLPNAFTKYLLFGLFFSQQGVQRGVGCPAKMRSGRSPPDLPEGVRGSPLYLR